MRQVYNQSLPNFYVVESPLEIRQLMRKSSSILFVPPLAMQRKFTEDSLIASGMIVHRIDEAMQAAQAVVVPGEHHPGRVLSSYTTSATGWFIGSDQVEQVVFWGIQPMNHLQQCRARVRHKDHGSLLTSPVPGYIYIGA